MIIGFWLGEASLENGGSSLYAWRVLETILNQSQSNEIDLLILCSTKVQDSCIKFLQKQQYQAKLLVIPELFKRPHFVKRLINKIILKLNIIRPEYLDPCFCWFDSLDIDLLHVPYQVSLYNQLRYPLITTMHDVQELHYPEFFTPQERAARAGYYWQSLESSSAVVVSFEHVKKDLIKYFRLPSEKIKVCPPPYSKIKLSPPNKEEYIVYQNKYNEWQDFVLYPAQTWEHKNHLSLIRALELIFCQTGKTVHLICTGKKNSDFFSKIENYLESSPISKLIHFMDIVPESELHWLYQNCSLVVIPTLYEAGSFPLLEAMSLEVPVICSSVTSLPETIADTRFVFEPLNIEQIANLILQLLSNSDLRYANIENGKKQISRLKQIDSARSFVELWKSFLN
ncbi:glycosyltransferase family 4 protein [Pseudanabaena sp. FACHB-1998]|uniref:glycosyltransferase family 4 protein n=1 Tax=Pseudanabaena sp. FACHB-1998 TaxID=2692858 RepID=UPI0016805721|nr:glycosyltransferase family 1 protein [Pseudanabaena sp. FACHB-1998]MBD2178834.1 glycosyltransferase family 4 protein [Pseudanabaena sp. FACHB-1998]